ncbi:unnamed protein product [Angiostrongylus costaricensis]|uniref:Reverse transcriptase domain-containing protein n=1 Tax=Angiostrongylus costaricensis TaxID=334426 RepID=A0A0R3PTY9_ANGCS|nr:unnamed protein product [Angiostrongylus costaricensis]
MDNIRVKIDGRQLYHLRFADDIVLITPNIRQAEHMFADFDKVCGKIALRLDLTKTMLMKNGFVSHTSALNGTNISECSSYIYLGHEINTMNDLALELSRGKRAAWGAFKSIGDVVKRRKNTRLRAHLFDSTELPAVTYASETWSLQRQGERSIKVIERAVERMMSGVSHSTQATEGIRSSELRQRSKIKDAVLYSEQLKIRWVGHALRMNDNRWTGAVSDWIPLDVKRTAGRPSTWWSEFFAKSLGRRYVARGIPRVSRTHRATLARNREIWKIY